MNKILLFDIETSPILAYVWDIWDQNIALNQIVEDWSVLSWSAKWLGDPPSKTMYEDQRNAKNVRDDRKLLKRIWELLDEADVVITQNGRRFDSKKLNARFIQNGMQPPSSYRHIDTLVISKKVFAFTSNKLEYLSNNLATRFKKLKTKQFPGFLLWSECLKKNKAAFKEMEAYNQMDVLALEEVYMRLAPWDNSVNLMVLNEDDIVCSCGSIDFRHKGYKYTNSGKFLRVKCKSCGKEYTSKANLLTKEQKAKLLK